MSTLISNFEILDKDKDKDLIEIKRKQLEDALKKVDYCITKDDKVLQNDDIVFFVNNKSINPLNSKNMEVDLSDAYIKDMQNFNKKVRAYLRREYTTKKELEDAIYEFNKMFHNEYLHRLNNQVKDLLNEDIKSNYLNKYASAFTMVQMQEIKKIADTDKDFMLLNLDDASDINFNCIVSIDILKKAQEDTREFLKKADNKRQDLPEDVREFIDDFNRDDMEFIIEKKLHNALYQAQNNQIIKDILDNEEYYKKIHRLYKTIDKNIIEVIETFKNASAILDISLKPQVQKIAKINSRGLKIPKEYDINFDISKLFDNIYQIDKYKSIDPDRHKDLDIKAKLLCDKDNLTLDEIVLVEYIKDNIIQLFPIQQALIQSFTDIRDLNPNKPIPLLKALKRITTNNKMRLPKSKKERQAYEDMMLLFNKLEVMVKIVDRKAKQTIFETIDPIPLLKNYRTINYDEFGYYIGNSIITILEDVFDEIYEIPHKTTLKDTTAQKLLLNNQTDTQPVINMKKFIEDKILIMTNTYKRLGTYQSKINIQTLYSYQAFYNKHNKPNKDDRRDAREKLEVFLNSLIDKGILVSFQAIEDKKTAEINNYRLKLNTKNIK